MRAFGKKEFKLLNQSCQFHSVLQARWVVWNQPTDWIWSTWPAGRLTLGVELCYLTHEASGSSVNCQGSQSCGSQHLSCHQIWPTGTTVSQLTWLHTWNLAHRCACGSEIGSKTSCGNYCCSCLSHHETPGLAGQITQLHAPDLAHWPYVWCPCSKWIKQTDHK